MAKLDPEGVGQAIARGDAERSRAWRGKRRGDSTGETSALA